MIGKSLLVRALTPAAALAVAALVVAVGAGASRAHDPGFVVHDLVSNQSGVADHTDANLKNSWGLAASATSPWWVADNGADVATVYDATGAGFPAASPLVVGVPTAPTGAVASTDSAFVVGTGASAGPSRFLFATEHGQILGWHGGLAAAVVGATSPSAGAIYKGLALANDHLYATDFHNGRVDVFDAGFGYVNMPGAFVDPKLPKGFAPFGIQNLGGTIYVTYAKQDADAHDDVHGQGLGFVDAYDTSGALLARVASRGGLNAPWGLATAPAGFGRVGGDLLVGNFGDGRINAFAPGDEHHGALVHALRDHGDGPGGGDRGDGDRVEHANGNGNDGDRGDQRNAPAVVDTPRQDNPPEHGNAFEPRGQLRGADGKRIAIDGLWALEFGMGAPSNGPATTLFFTAGPDDESNGLFGTITAG